VIRRRLVPLALVVTALVALAALAAHGRPLSGGGLGVGPSAAFYDYAFTTVLIVVLLAAVATLVALYALRRGPEERKPYQARTFRALVTLLAAAALLALLGRHVNLEHLLHPHQATTAQTLTTPPPGAGKAHPPRPAAPRHVQFRWQELAAVLGLLLLLVAAGARRSRRGPPRLRESAQEELAAILDESLDDLRSDPDLRRAIVAAYARMEAALAAAGVPRHPAEAPLEYLERALLALDASAPAVRRLTELFEWARFSHHEPEPRMRDEAVDALAAVRDELRAAEPVPA
jgi:hypothetical protein